VVGEAHPLNLGFGGANIPFADLNNPVNADVVQPVGSAVVVFARGSGSDRAGEPALIAYESGPTRVAYATFPLVALQELDLALLLQNAMFWFAPFGVG
jgi:hypothetical protein